MKKSSPEELPTPSTNLGYNPQMVTSGKRS